MIKKLYLFLLLILISSSCYGEDIDSCRIINSPGNYIINDTIPNQNGTCFDINSNDVIFDCDNHNLQGNSTEDGFNLGTYTNITIKNCNIYNFSSGIHIAGGDYNILDNVVSNNNSLYGIYLASSSNFNILNQITTINNSNLGIRLSVALYNNLTNIISNYNKESGIELGFGSNYNHLENIETNYNQGSYGGIRLSNSNNNTINTFNSNFNVYAGILTEGSNYNIISSGTISFNGGIGLALNWGGDYNKISNLNIDNNNRGLGISSGSYNFLTGLNILNNTDIGLYIYHNSFNNTISSCFVEDNGNYNVKLYLVTTNIPINNTITNSHLGNSSKIDSDNWALTVPNDFISNYYINYNGTGDICFSAGICDSNPREEVASISSSSKSNIFPFSGNMFISLLIIIGGLLFN